MGEPPVSPAVKLMRAVPSPAATDETTGASGAEGVVTLDVADGAPEPEPFTARIATEYVVPAARPEICSGLDGEPADVHTPSPFNSYA